MASNANFISQFVMGGDPCTYKESGELQAEMSKLTHPARPDVDWRRVEKLSLALFRQNGVELQTQVCYVLAITRRQGLAGMADGLGSLDILLQRWADFWPVQVHSRISLLSWVTEKMQQALRTLDIQYLEKQSEYMKARIAKGKLDPAEQIAMMRIKGRQLKSDPDWRNRSGSILKKQYARRDILKNRVWERSPSIKSVSVELKTEAIRRMKNRKVVGEKVQDIADDLNVSISRLYHWLKM
ncbi:hypothetical protein CTR33_003627 [Escherichia coli]|nr:hypothetical protein [Escherichia coli]EEV8729869.1 hypothetical protein [Escherichia coli]EEW0652913.1 hypothetical protein [Escherichia coli]EEY1244593.1 hypothetical protein [Escherichia coli]EEZ7067249.1 hypothetical protein [Escherichia coli]